MAVTDCHKVIYKQSFGFENAMRPEVPTHPDTLYVIASMTKNVVTVMLMKMIEEGLLDLDFPIKKYLPQISFANPESTETMTLRHLLTHTSGMPGDVYVPDGSRNESTMNDEIIAMLPDLELLSLPSDGKYCYSNRGFSLAGCIASEVAGKPFSQLLSQYILKPLGMAMTTLDYPEASTYPFSHPHRCDENGVLRVIHKPRINTLNQAGGGIYSNTEDMCKFVRLLLNGGIADSGERIISEESLLMMFTKHIKRPNQGNSYYGLGTCICPLSDRYMYGHNGNLDPYNSSFFIDEKTKCGVVTLMNSPSAELRESIPTMIFNMIEE